MAQSTIMRPVFPAGAPLHRGRPSCQACLTHRRSGGSDGERSTGRTALASMLTRRGGPHFDGAGRDGEAACPRCGQGFACGADRPVADPCWCTRVALAGMVLDRLATTFDGCLCPTCLREQASVAEG